MTHQNEQTKKIAELNTLFLSLDKKGQESALIMLRSLGFAQLVTTTSTGDCKPPAKRSE